VSVALKKLFSRLEHFKCPQFCFAPQLSRKKAVPATFKVFSEANAVLSGFFHSLDFCSTFDQAKVERKKKEISF